MPSTIRDLLDEGEFFVAPSAYDGISARLVRQLGFKAAYVGSYATGATLYGLPDIGFISAQDVAGIVRRVSDVADVPIIADGEGGFGNPLHVQNSVRVLERAGASAIHIEDHVFGKHLGRQTVLPVDRAVDKIKAAVDARNADTLIIARSDASVAEGVSATVDRLLAYQEAGADALFFASNEFAEALEPRLVASASVPIFAVNDPRYSADAHRDAGAAALIYFGVSHFAAYRALREAYEQLRDNSSTAELDPSLPGIEEFDAFLSIDEFRDATDRYRVLS